MKDTSQERIRIAEWINQQWQEDYFRFNRVISEFCVLELIPQEQGFIAEYKFWSDETRADDSAENYLFEDAVSRDKYGVYIPVNLQLFTLKTRFTWETKADFAKLDKNFEEDEIDTDVLDVYWDDLRMDPDFITAYILSPDQRSLAELLIEEYGAANGLPDFLPSNLEHYFTSLVASNIH